MRETGSIVDGKYEVVETLGRGGMGEVYLVRHLHLEELRVIKILRQDLAADETVQKRFLREARLATQIKHPNVAILYDFSRLPEGSFYMVWEHIEGQHVGQWLAEKGYLPLSPALELGIQTLRGLEAIHASGVVHRDVSPDNLMITRDRRGRYLVKIIDLGLAKNLVADPNFEVTQVGMFMGKLKYCSPEQAEAHNGELVDARSDLYSFGLVLYEMICGLPPFDAENPHAAVMKRLSEPPLPLSGRNSEVSVPAELDQVFARALARAREDRFPDAVHFIEALEPLAFHLRQDGGKSPGRQMSAHRPTEIPSTGSAAAPARSKAAGDDSSQLSKAERLELLAQIDRAAKKKTETTQILRRAEKLIEVGKVEQARDLIGRVEASAPRAPDLERIRKLLEEAEERMRKPAAATSEIAPAESSAAEPKTPPSPAPSPEPEPAVETSPETSPETRVEPVTQPIDTAAAREALEAPPPERIRKIEKMIEGYIRKRQLQLAELALETLIEQQPIHPKRGDYEQWIALLREELEQDRKADEALAAGRVAIEQGAFKTARKRLAELAKHDRTGERAEAFEEELEAAEQSEQQAAGIEEHRDRFEELLEKGKLTEADQEIRRLAELGASRVTLDLLRGRLDEARDAAEAGREIESLEKRFRELVAQRDWHGARATAQEVSRAQPESSRPAEMVAEVSRLEEEDRRREAIEQGAQQVEQLLDAGEADQAELALQILLRMDPRYKRRKQLEKRIRALRG